MKINVEGAIMCEAQPYLSILKDLLALSELTFQSLKRCRQEVI